jgi:DNA-binding response OmpR family regulator
MHVLLVEDDPRISALTARGLAEHGFSVDKLTSGDGVSSRLRDADYQCLILDLMLPDVDGQRSKRLTRCRHDVPVILLTARNEIEDRLTGPELGSDDYSASRSSSRS